MLGWHLRSYSSDGLMLMMGDLSGPISELSFAVLHVSGPMLSEMKDRPLRRTNTQSWKSNAPKRRRRRKEKKLTQVPPEQKRRTVTLSSWYTLACMQTVRKAKAHWHTQRFVVAHMHARIFGLCLHMCKNNKANLVKRVGGEAAKQKDINSLSEIQQ